MVPYRRMPPRGPRRPVQTARPPAPALGTRRGGPRAAAPAGLRRRGAPSRAAGGATRGCASRAMRCRAPSRAPQLVSAGLGSLQGMLCEPATGAQARVGLGGNGGRCGGPISLAEPYKKRHVTRYYLRIQCLFAMDFIRCTSDADTRGSTVEAFFHATVRKSRSAIHSSWSSV